MGRTHASALLMIRFQTRAAHCYERVRRLAVNAAVFQIRRVVRRRRVLAVDTLPRQRCAGAQDLRLRRVDEADMVLFRKGEDLMAAHGLSDGDALGDGRRWPHCGRLQLAVCRGAQERIAVLALQSNDLRLFFLGH